MKKFFCLAFILFAAISVFAQDAEAEKPIEKAEFDTVSLKSLRKFAGQSYRQTEFFQDISTVSNENNFSSKSIMEFASAARASRFIYEVDSSTMKKERKKSESAVKSTPEPTTENGRKKSRK